MNRLVYAILFLFVHAQISLGQITITNSVFPSAGDTLKSLITLSPSGVDLLSTGGPQSWDFSMLDARVELDVEFLDAQDGEAYDEFSEADLVSIIPPNNERYVTVDANTVSELGFVGSDPVVGEFSIASKYESPYVLQRAPLNFGDVNTASTKLVTTLPFDSIPDTLVMGLPINPDSIRVSVTIQRNSEVDAWGDITTPSGKFDVLRERSVETRTTGVEAYTTLFGWSDVTNLIAGILPDPTLLDPVETEAYVFLANDIKEPIASVTVDSNGDANRVQMYRSSTVSSRDLYQNVSATLSPNPTYGKTRLQFAGLPAGNYQLWVYDILGNALAHDDHFLDGSGSIKKDFSYLNKGTYLYSLKDQKGEVITTKRLVIITP